MVAIYCAVEGCWGSKESKHRFPNPLKYMDLFKKWVMLCGNKRLLEMTSEKVFSDCRVCRMHFTEADFGTNNKLTRYAYPTKFLPAEKDMVCPTSQSQVELGDVEACTSGEVLTTSHAPVTDECKTPPNVKGRRNPILLSIGLSRQSQLTPKKKTLYKQLTHLKQVAYNLNKSKMSFRKRLFEAAKFSLKHNFEKLLEDFDSIQKRFIK